MGVEQNFFISEQQASSGPCFVFEEGFIKLCTRILFLWHASDFHKKITWMRAMTISKDYWERKSRHISKKEFFSIFLFLWNPPFSFSWWCQAGSFGCWQIVDRWEEGKEEGVWCGRMGMLQPPPREIRGKEKLDERRRGIFSVLSDAVLLLAPLKERVKNVNNHPLGQQHFQFFLASFHCCCPKKGITFFPYNILV